jgi:hypothetical protein
MLIMHCHFLYWHGRFHHVHGKFGVGMTNVVSTDNASPCFFIGYVMTIGQKKVMSRMCVSINKENALHVLIQVDWVDLLILKTIVLECYVSEGIFKVPRVVGYNLSSMPT